jgi:curved DNA-binding protein CbpA
MHSRTENFIFDHKNYYNVMGIASTATAREVSKTFKKLALKWHPDRHQEYQKSFAHTKFISIMEAYEILGNPDRRVKYDSYRQHLNHRRAYTRPSHSQPAHNQPAHNQQTYSQPAYATSGHSGMGQNSHSTHTEESIFEVTRKFEKELFMWSKKAGSHARNMATKSYMQFAGSLEIVSKLVVQGIFNTIDLFSGRAQTTKELNRYKEQLDKTPNDSITHYRIGFLYHQSGNHKEAAACYLKSLRLNPKDADVFCNLGRLREEQYEYKRAISCYEKAVELNPDLYIVYAYLGIIHLRMEHYIEAKKCLDYLMSAGQDGLASQIEQSFG